MSFIWSNITGQQACEPQNLNPFPKKPQLAIDISQTKVDPEELSNDEEL